MSPFFIIPLVDGYTMKKNVSAAYLIFDAYDLTHPMKN
jgi:hypothetical protein